MSISAPRVGTVVGSCGHTVEPADACSYVGKDGPVIVCRRCCRYCSPTAWDGYDKAMRAFVASAVAASEAYRAAAARGA